MRNKKLAVRLILPGSAAPSGRSPNKPRTPGMTSGYGSSPRNASPSVMGGRYVGGDGGRGDGRSGVVGGGGVGSSSSLDEDSRELVSKYDDVSLGAGATM